MAWNESNKEDNGWGKRPKEDGPPDLDKLLGDLFQKLGVLFGGRRRGVIGGGSPLAGFSSLLKLLLLVVVVIWFLSGIFIIDPTEQAVVLRLGKYNKTLNPGPHWIPRFIDSKIIVNVQTVSSFQFDADLLTKSTGDSDKPPSLIVVEKTDTTAMGSDDSDKNVVYVELSVQYRISDPMLYLYNIVNAPQTLQEVAKATLSQVVGSMQLNDVLTIGRDELARQVTSEMQGLMDQYQTGLEIVVANVRKAQAPEEVADAFLEVVQAGQDQQRYIQQAQAYASKVVPIAEGVKARLLANAEASQQKVVYNAKANIATYDAILSVYKKEPSITRERLYLDAMQNIMSNTTKVFVDTDKANNLLYIPIDKLVSRKPGPIATTDLTSSSLSATADEAAHSRSLPSDDLYKAMYSRLSSENNGGGS